MKNENSTHWKQVLMGVAFIALASIVSTSIPLLYNYFDLLVDVKKPQPSPQSIVEIPTITKEGIVDSISNQQKDKLLETTDYEKINLLMSPIETPSFVTNPDKLRSYLEQKNVAIVIEGNVDKAFLYLKAKHIDINNESIYFFIVDGYSRQGHLVSSESLISGSGNDFLYDLRQLPLASLPFPLENKKQTFNIVDDFLNRDITYKHERKYYVGGFVSTTQLPNSLDIMEIRYTCKPTITCAIHLSAK